MTVPVLTQFEIDPAEEGAFLQVLRDVLATTRASAGLEQVEVLLNADDRSKVHLLERWADRKSYEAYLTWRKAEVSGPSIAPYLKGRPSVTVLELQDV